MEEPQMLVLTRAQDQSILLQTSDGPIEITVTRSDRPIRIGIEAPRSVRITRPEHQARTDETAPQH